VDERIARITPLVDQLSRLCRGHEARDTGIAAVGMLAYLRDAWPDIPVHEMRGERKEVGDPGRIALGIVHDVGELARMLRDGDDPEAALAWSRANLIVEIEAYTRALRAD
jgi:hypothetical protein